MLREECVRKMVMAWLVGLAILGGAGQAHSQHRDAITVDFSAEHG